MEGKGNLLLLLLMRVDRSSTTTSIRIHDTQREVTANWTFLLLTL